VARSDENIMASTIALAEVGGTTGEWAGVLRETFGEYRAPTGVGTAAGAGPGNDGLAAVARRVQALPGGPVRLLVGQARPRRPLQRGRADRRRRPRRRHGGDLPGIRLTPAQIAAAARDEDVEVVGLSILSGSHLELVPEVVRLLAEDGVDVPVIVGGIIPPDDEARLLSQGITAVYTPKNFELATIMGDIANLAIARR
jgi:(2R)-ethylmalonyl-CoA mutase